MLDIPFFFGNLVVKFQFWASPLHIQQPKNVWPVFPYIHRGDSIPRRDDPIYWSQSHRECCHGLF